MALLATAQLQMQRPLPLQGRVSGNWPLRACKSKHYPDFADGDYRVKLVTAKELDRVLFSAKRELPVIVDFYATWCGPCVMLAQTLEQLAVEYDQQVRFLKVDTDDEYELANQMGLRGLPTMLFVSTNLEKHALRTEGALPIEVIRDLIEKEFEVPAEGHGHAWG